ncbi:MAG TPA: winged helix-turn-helix domain-containing protein [Gaiellaceae bacterium]|jgi:DNA-binding transcriptional ArsR family regulator|nr:winged helix-turn-helix domain-containing protein [Gaiellaceae bacterium]
MAAAESKPLLDVLTLDQPEQLKALGHPLRLRVLETLGAGESEHLTNRELASRLGVDPGHLHFHVRMLLRAGLIELAEAGQGREKPYRAVARTVRVAPALLKSEATSDLRAAMLDEVQRGWAEHGTSGKFRSAQVTARITPEQAVELIQELVERAREAEDPSQGPIVITTVLHPPTTVDLQD